MGFTFAVQNPVEIEINRAGPQDETPPARRWLLFHQDQCARSVVKKA